MAKSESGGKPIRGRTLQAAVKMAETTGLGHLVRAQFFRDVNMGALFQERAGEQGERGALLPFVAPDVQQPPLNSMDPGPEVDE